MLNPALAEMAAHDRIRELRRAGAKRSSGAESRVTTGATRSRRPGWSIQDAHRIHPGQAIGWSLVSIGLRLALPRARSGSAR